MSELLSAPDPLVQSESRYGYGIIGSDVFTGKIVKGRVPPMNKKAGAAKFKKYAVPAG